MPQFGLAHTTLAVPSEPRKLHGQYVHDLDYVLTRWGVAPGSKTKTKARTSNSHPSLPRTHRLTHTRLPTRQNTPHRVHAHTLPPLRSTGTCIVGQPSCPIWTQSSRFCSGSSMTFRYVLPSSSRMHHLAASKLQKCSSSPPDCFMPLLTPTLFLPTNRKQ